MHRISLLLTLLVVLGAGSTAFAHPQAVLHSHTQGFEAGFLHPLLGLDHILTMILVGVLAARMSGRAVWLVPSAFVMCMVKGFIAGTMGTPLPGAETAIAVSIVLLGLAASTRAGLPLNAMLIGCGAFGYVHGHAHGTEMPSMAQPVLYGIGFVLATLALQLTGILIERFAARTAARQWKLRLAGAAVAATGLLLLLKTG